MTNEWQINKEKKEQEDKEKYEFNWLKSNLERWLVYFDDAWAFMQDAYASHTHTAAGCFVESFVNRECTFNITYDV